ncbi:RDD family protein [Emticicia sp. C21]|uniref:RDD family protein n=1 Tax=Emticicia sp. C21 TaxID=2302915 RepID=UPI000E356D10|nr:RDD family protein [Emticicia sp. C21]RFS14442.1 RDD family protein [Emticicia sp. C21]
MNNFRLAGFGKRFLAYIIDGILLGIAFMLIFLPFGGLFAFLGLGSGRGLSDGEAAAMAVTGGVSILGIILIAIIAPVVYDALMTASPRQGTLGKSIMKIKVIKENGEPLNTNEAFIRALVKFVAGQFCILLLLVCLFNKEEQNLHDLAAKTLVVED